MRTSWIRKSLLGVRNSNRLIVPRLERLEDRLAPATIVWNQTAAGSYTYSTGANWVGGLAPGSGDVASFTNDIAGNQTIDFTSPATLQGIVLGDSNNTHAFALTGSAITLNTANGIVKNLGSGSTNTTADTIANAITLGANATAVTNDYASASLALNGAISGSFSVSKSGPGTVVLGTANSYSGTTTVSAGTLKMGHADALGATSAATTVSSGATLDVNGFSNLEPLTLSGSGVGSGTSLGAVVNTSATLSSLGGAVALAATATVYVPSSAIELNGTVSGSGGLTKTGGGDLTVGGNNTFTGTTTINAGRINAVHNGALGSTSGGTVVNSGATLNLGASSAYPAEPLALNGGTLGAGAQTFAGDVTLTGTSTINCVSITPLTLSGVVSGSGGFNKIGTGALTLGGANTYAGDTTIQQGTLKLGAANVIPDGSGKGNVVLNPGSGHTATLDLGGFSETINGLSSSGAGSSVVDNTTAGGPFTLTVGGNDATGTFGGVVKNTAGTLALAKIGAGTLTLGGANTFHGNVTISAGTMGLGHASALGDTVVGATTVSSGATLDVNGFSTNEPLTLNGSGVGSGTSLGALVNTVIAVASLGGDVSLAATTTVYANVGHIDLNGTISGSGGLTKTGGADLVLGGSNTFTGTTTINAGRINARHSNALGSTSGGTVVEAGAILNLGASSAFLAEPLLLNGGLLRCIVSAQTFPGDVTLTGTPSISCPSNCPLTLSGVVSGSGFDKQGPDVLTLSGNNTFTGTVTISAGTLVVGHVNALGSTSAATTVNSGATLDLNGFSPAEPLTLNGSGVGSGTSLGALVNSASVSTLSGTITLASTATVYAQGVSLTLSGVVSGSGGFIKTGPGALILSGANTYAGDTTIQQGTLKLGAANVIPDGSGKGNVVFNPTIGNTATLDLGFSETINGLSSSGAGSSVIDNAGGDGSTLTVGANDATSTFNGVIQNTVTYIVGLAKIGAGTLTLGGANTFQGNVTISAGTLVLGHESALGATFIRSTTVNSGATLDLSGFSTAEVLTLNGSGVGSGTSLGALVNSSTFRSVLTDQITLASTATVYAQAGIDFYGQVTGSGGLTKTGGAILSLFNSNNDYTGATTIDGGTLGIYGNGTLGTTAAGTTVNSGAALFFERTSAYVTAEPLTLTAGATLANYSFPHSYSGPVTVEGTSTIDCSVFGSLTVTGVVSGSGGFNKLGLGILVLSGANTYAGDTTIQRGTLWLGAANVIPDGSGKGNIVLNPGSGDTATLNLNGFSETINGLSSSGAGSSFVDNLGGGTPTLTVGGNDATGTFGGVVKNTSGTLALTKIGAGTLTLGGANTFAGAMTINAGTVVAGHAGAFGSTAAGVTVASGATLDLDGVLVLVNEPLTLNGAGVGGGGALKNSSAAYAAFLGNVVLASDATINTEVGNIELGGVVSGPGGIVKIGSSQLNLANSNTYEGVTTIQSGTVSPYLDGGLGTTAGNTIVNAGAELILFGAYFTLEQLILNGGTLSNLFNPVTFAGPVVLAVTSTFQPSWPLTLTGVLSGSGGVIKTDRMFGPLPVLTLSGANTYAGNTTISQGVLKLGAANVIPNGPGKGNVVFNPSSGNTATLDLAGFSETINGLSSSGAGSSVVDNTVDNGTTTLTVGANNAGGTFGGVIQNTAGMLALVKTGNGTLALSGTNTFTGGVTVNRGKLQVSADANFGAASNQVAVTSPGEVVVAGNVVTSRAFDLQDGTLTINLTKTLTLQGETVWGGSIRGPGTLATAGGQSATLDGSTFGNSLTVLLNGTDSLEDVTNAGVITVSSGVHTVSLTGSFVNQATGRLIVGADSTTNIEDFTSLGQTTVSGTLVNVGAGIVSLAAGSTTTIDAGGSFYVSAVDAAIDVAAGAVFNVSGEVNAANLHVSGQMNVNEFGEVEKNFGNDGFVFESGSTTIVSAGGTLDTGEAAALVAGGFVKNYGIFGSTDQDVIVDSGGTVTGPGTFRSVVTRNGGVFSPGASPGGASISSFPINGGGIFGFEISNATGTAANVSGWDMATVAPNALSPVSAEILITATPANKYVIAITSRLDDGLGQTAGAAANFDPTVNYAWKFLDGSHVATTVTGTFDPAAFSIVTSGFQNTIAGVFTIELRDGGKNFYVVYTAAPVVTSVAPFIGPTSGGNVVIITGTSFTSIEPAHLASAVKFGAANAVDYTVNSATQITATVPAGAAATINVVVTNPGGSSASDATDGSAAANDYTYATPSLVSVVINGGTIVARNRFGGTPALANQNSVVEQILVTFNMRVTLDANAFAVSSLASSVSAQGIAPSALGAIVVATPVSGTGDAVDGYTQYVLTFGAGSGVNSFNNGVSPNVGNSFTTLKDGFFSLDLTGAKVHAGVSNTGADRADKFWVLYGAVNAGDVKINGALGDTATDTLLVDGLALNDIYSTFGSSAQTPSGPPTYKVGFDWNLDGNVDGVDLTKLYQNFGTIWRF